MAKNKNLDKERNQALFQNMAQSFSAALSVEQLEGEATTDQAINNRAIEKRAQVETQYRHLNHEQMLHAISILEVILDLQTARCLRIGGLLQKSSQVLPLIPRLAASEQSANMNDKRREKNQPTKDAAESWFAKNEHLFHRNLDGMAEAATKEFSYEFKTLRKWIREWRKKRKLPSPGRRDSN
jgi:hypothetical protein